MSVVDQEKVVATSSDPNDHIVQFDRSRGCHYKCCTLCCTFPLMTSGLGCICLPCIPYYAKREINSQQCKITDRRVEFDHGWINKTSKQIPLDRIQDVTVEESCCQRCFGVKALGIQTAGTGGPVAEAYLIAPSNATMVRDVIIQRRDQLVFGAGLNGVATGSGTASVGKGSETRGALGTVGGSLVEPTAVVVELRELKEVVGRIEDRINEGLERMR